MKVLVLGGDTRQIYCAGRLSLEPNMIVHSCGLGCDEAPHCSADVLVLPYVTGSGGLINAPLSQRIITVDEAVESVKEGGTVFLGMLDKEQVKRFEDKYVKVYDWFSDEELTLANAGLTAEGAAQIIVKSSEYGLGGSRILILGWGRVARECAKLFGAMGADVTVSARKSQALDDAAGRGFKTAEFIDKSSVAAADIIVNTVPQNVLFEDTLRCVKKGGWILELASKPYGVDMNAASRLGVKVNIASGIPGRYTPESAGRQMAQSVIRRLKGDGEAYG